MLKVLVADDDATLRLTVSSALLASGRFQVEEAVDGMDAVEKIKSGHYQLVLLDVDMPRMTGLEALKEIKEHDPSIIALIMTAYANVNDAVIAVKEGAYDYLSKPVKEDRHQQRRYLVVGDIAGNISAHKILDHQSHHCGVRPTDLEADVRGASASKNHARVRGIDRCGWLREHRQVDGADRNRRRGCDREDGRIERDDIRPGIHLPPRAPGVVITVIPIQHVVSGTAPKRVRTRPSVERVGSTKTANEV